MIFTGLFSASPGAQLQEITSSLFRSNGSNTIAIVQTFFFDPMDDRNRICPNCIEEVLTVISRHWAPGEAGVQHVMHR